MNSNILIRHSDDELAARLLATVDRCSHGEPLSEPCQKCDQDGAEARSLATMAAQTAPGLSPAEAVYGLLGWLTSREQVVTFSSKHLAVDAGNAAAEFCEANGLGDCRDGWEKNLTHPEGPPTDHTASEVERPAGQSD